MSRRRRRHGHGHRTPRSVQPHRRAALRQAEHTEREQPKQNEDWPNLQSWAKMRDVCVYVLCEHRAPLVPHTAIPIIPHTAGALNESEARLQEIALVPLRVRLGGTVQEHGRSAEEDELGRLAGRGLDRLLVSGRSRAGRTSGGAVWGHGRVQPRAAVAAAHAECPRAPTHCVAV